MKKKSASEKLGPIKKEGNESTSFGKEKRRMNFGAILKKWKNKLVPVDAKKQIANEKKIMLKEQKRMEKINKIRSKNVFERWKKENKKLLKEKRKNEKNNKKASQMEIFSKSYADRREALIDWRINKVEKKYNLKISMAGDSPVLRLMKLRLSRLMQKQNAKENKILALKIQTISEKIKAKELQQNERRRKKIESKCKKIDHLPVMRYYNTRLSYLQKIYQNKHRTVAQKLAKAAITSKQGEDREQRIQIDEGTAYLRWDKKAESLRTNTQIGRTAIKKAKLNETKSKAIAALAARKEMPSAFTIPSGIKDAWEVLKSNYVGGHEIKTVFNKTSSHLRKFSMYYIFAAIMIIFGIATTWQNFKSDNIATIIETNLYILVIGLAMLLVIVAGAIDLSVGSMLGFAGVLSVYTFNQFGGNIAASVITTLLFGLGYGLFQGFLIGYLKMPSFIVTLGGMLFFAGLALYVTKGTTFTPVGGNKSSYVEWVTGSFETLNSGFHVASFLIIFLCGILAAMILIYGRSKKVKYGIESGNILSFAIKILFIVGLFAAVGYFIADSIFGIKYYMLYLIALIIIFMFLTTNTSFGRAVYAVGGNKKAAFLSGINVARTQMLVFAVTGTMTAFCSLLYSAINIAAASSTGTGFELDVISSVFVGGASMTGGIGTIPGTLIGGLALGFINNGIILLNLGTEIQRIVRACILIAAVGYDVYTHRKIG